MRVFTISRTPISANRLEQAGCRLLGKASASDTFFAVMECLEVDHGLTDRQMEVLRLAAGGLTVAEIAKKRKLGKKVMDDLIYLAFMNRLQPIAPSLTRPDIVCDLTKMRIITVNFSWQEMNNLC